jgi:hypothetical protein
LDRCDAAASTALPRLSRFLQLLQLLGIGRFPARRMSPSSGTALLADPMLPAQIRRRHAFLRLLQNAGDLLLAMSCATHFMSLLFFVRTNILCGTCFEGQVTRKALLTLGICFLQPWKTGVWGARLFETTRTSSSFSSQIWTLTGSASY